MFRTIQVLIIAENQADVSDMLHELSQAGYTPEWQQVENETSYVNHLKDDLDLILVDDTLPQCRAMRALQLLQEHAFDIPLIVVTESRHEADAVACARQGAADYVLKERLGQLGQAVTRALMVPKLHGGPLPMERAQRQSEERFRNLVEGSLHGIVIHHDGRPLFANHAYAEILGYATPQDIIALRTILTCFAPHERARIKRYHEQRRRGQYAPTRYEVQGQRSNGTIVWLELNVRIIIWAGTLAHQLTIADISERKRAEEMLRRSEARNRALLYAIPDIMLHLSKDGIVLDGKLPRTSDPLILPQASIGKPLSDVLSREATQHVMQQLERALQSHMTQISEHQLSRSGLQREYEIRTVLSGAEEVLTFIRDITERKQLERTILDISERERWRLGQDLHDGLGQHLTGIGFLSKALSQKMATQAPAMAAAAEQIATLVNDAIVQVREMARGLYPVALEIQGLVPMLQELAANTERTFGLHCRMICEPTIWLPDEESVIRHLYRLAQEAVTNAVKHGRPQQVIMSLTTNDHGTVLSVSDNGSGLTEIDEGHSGMGLRTMRYRARMIGAALDIYRNADGGTTVMCTVPKTMEWEGT